MEFALPELGEGVYEAEFQRWLVASGESVKRGQPLFEIMTDKATMEVPAPFSGVIDELRAEPGQKVKIGAVMLTYTTGSAAGTAKALAAASVPPSAPTTAVVAGRTPSAGNGSTLRVSTLAVRAAPSVRHLARKMGIDLATVQGSGPEGRILLEDLTPRVQLTTPPTGAPSEPSAEYGRPGTRIKMAGLRRLVAEHMVHSKHTIPHYSYIDECEVTELVRLREGLKERFARRGVKLTYLAFWVKAVVQALKEVPLVNSSLDEETQEIVLHDRYDIGVAVATPTGLVVPVIRGADRKSVGEIARTIDQLSQEVRQGKARREDLKGSTFTITSVGNLGGLISTPVINHPEVAILGLGQIVKRPVFDDRGNIRPADIVYLSLSFDHRVVDGAIGAVFANVLLREMRTPASLLLADEEG